jgi:hypothetical protein
MLIKYGANVAPTSWICERSQSGEVSAQIKVIFHEFFMLHTYA